MKTKTPAQTRKTKTLPVLESPPPGKGVEWTRFSSTPNGVVSKQDAPSVAKALLKMKDKHGGSLTGADIAKEVMGNLAHYLHDAKWFTLDKTEAAWERWKDQARHLAASVTIEVKYVGSDVIEPVRLFPNVVVVHSPMEDTADFRLPNGFYAVNDMMNNPMLFNSWLIKGMQELKAFKARYHTIVEFKKVFDAVDELQQELETLMKVKG